MPTPTTTDIQIATDTSFNTLSINETKPYCTTRTFAPEELPHGVDLYMRVRHHTDDASIDTPWSDTRYFQIEPDTEIIGICMDNSDTSKKPVWNWIDKDGNRVDSFNYQEYPIYKNTEIVQLSNTPEPSIQYLKIPRVYVKTMVSGPINTFAAGKKCWWISNRPLDDFYIHPAFCRNDDNGYTTNICEYVYFQQMPYSSTGGGFESPGDDFRVFDIYDFGLIRLLITIANTGSDDSLTFDSSSNIKFTFYHDYVSGAFLNGVDPVKAYIYMVNPVQSCTKVLDGIITSFLGSSVLEYTDDLTQNASLTKCLISRRYVYFYGGTLNPDGFVYIPTISPIYSRDYISGSDLLGYKEGNTSTDSLIYDLMCLFIPGLSEEHPSADLSFAYYSKESVKYESMGPDPMDPMDPMDPFRSSSNKSSKNKGPNWLFRCYGKTPLNMVIRPFAQGTSQPGPDGYIFNGLSTDTIRYCAY